VGTPLKWYAAMMVVVGLFVPIIPRVVIPLARPRGGYKDTLPELVTALGVLVAVCAWTALPFAGLALFALFNLRINVHPALFRRRLLAITLTFLVAWIFGFICHIPQTVAGVNFAFILFPVYTAVIVPLTYAVAYALGGLASGLNRDRMAAAWRRGR
jgi:hypothetical protein